jgi:N-acetylglucosamine repressor
MANVGRGSHRPLLGINSATVGERNRSAVFEAIRHYAPISRKALANHSGLNPATVTHIVDDLLAAGLVEETDAAAAERDGMPAKRAAGRRPTGLTIKADACYLVGINLTRTHAMVVVTNLAAEIVAHANITVSLSHSTDMRVSRVLDLVEQAILQSGVPRHRLSGIGVGAPGPLNTRTGMIMAATFEGWTNVPFKALLEARFGLPVAIDSDVNTAALAEQWFGAGREYTNFAYVAVGAGVGAGIIVDGHLFTSGGDRNPEFGHSSIQFDGPHCPCGNRGCLELYVSTPHLVATTIEAVRLGGYSSLTPLVPKSARHAETTPDPMHEDYDALTPERIWDAVETGDSLAISVVQRVCEHLATGLASLVAFFHPSVIFIGHDMARAGPKTYLMLQIAMRDRGVPSHVLVLPAEIDDHTPALGAVTLALRELFVTPGFYAR